MAGRRTNNGRKNYAVKFKRNNADRIKNARRKSVNVHKTKVDTSTCCCSNHQIHTFLHGNVLFNYDLKVMHVRCRVIRGECQGDLQ